MTESEAPEKDGPSRKRSRKTPERFVAGAASGAIGGDETEARKKPKTQSFEKLAVPPPALLERRVSVQFTSNKRSAWYHGRVTEYDSEQDKYRIQYDDGETETGQFSADMFHSRKTRRQPYKWLNPETDMPEPGPESDQPADASVPEASNPAENHQNASPAPAATDEQPPGAALGPAQQAASPLVDPDLAGDPVDTSEQKQQGDLQSAGNSPEASAQPGKRKARKPKKNTATATQPTSQAPEQAAGKPGQPVKRKRGRPRKDDVTAPSYVPPQDRAAELPKKQRKSMPEQEQKPASPPQQVLGQDNEQPAPAAAQPAPAGATAGATPGAQGHNPSPAAQSVPAPKPATHGTVTQLDLEAVAKALTGPSESAGSNMPEAAALVAPRGLAHLAKKYTECLTELQSMSREYLSGLPPSNRAATADVRQALASASKSGPTSSLLQAFAEKNPGMFQPQGRLQAASGADTAGQLSRPGNVTASLQTGQGTGAVPSSEVAKPSGSPRQDQAPALGEPVAPARPNAQPIIENVLTDPTPASQEETAADDKSAEPHATPMPQQAVPSLGQATQTPAPESNGQPVLLQEPPLNVAPAHNTDLQSIIEAAQNIPGLAQPASEISAPGDKPDAENLPSAELPSELPSKIDKVESDADKSGPLDETKQPTDNTEKSLLEATAAPETAELAAKPDQLGQPDNPASPQPETQAPELEAAAVKSDTETKPESEQVTGSGQDEAQPDKAQPPVDEVSQPSGLQAPVQEVEPNVAQPQAKATPAVTPAHEQQPGAQAATPNAKGKTEQKPKIPLTRKASSQQDKKAQAQPDTAQTQQPAGAAPKAAPRAVSSGQEKAAKAATPARQPGSGKPAAKPGPQQNKVKSPVKGAQPAKSPVKGAQPDAAKPALAAERAASKELGKPEAPKRIEISQELIKLAQNSVGALKTKNTTSIAAPKSLRSLPQLPATQLTTQKSTTPSRLSTLTTKVRQHEFSPTGSGSDAGEKGQKVTEEELEAQIICGQLQACLPGLTKQKPSIVKATMTALAGAKCGASAKIVRLITEQMQKAKDENHLVALLFLVDSILQGCHKSANPGCGPGSTAASSFPRVIAAALPHLIKACSTSPACLERAAKVLDLWEARRLVASKQLHFHQQTIKAQLQAQAEARPQLPQAAAPPPQLAPSFAQAAPAGRSRGKAVHLVMNQGEESVSAVLEDQYGTNRMSDEMGLMRREDSSDSDSDDEPTEHERHLRALAGLSGPDTSPPPLPSEPPPVPTSNGHEFHSEGSPFRGHAEGWTQVAYDAADKGPPGFSPARFTSGGISIQLGKRPASHQPSSAPPPQGHHGRAYDRRSTLGLSSGYQAAPLLVSQHMQEDDRLELAGAQDHTFFAAPHFASPSFPRAPSQDHIGGAPSHDGEEPPPLPAEDWDQPPPLPQGHEPGTAWPPGEEEDAPPLPAGPPPEDAPPLPPDMQGSEFDGSWSGHERGQPNSEFMPPPYS